MLNIKQFFRLLPLFVLIAGISGCAETQVLRERNIVMEKEIGRLSRDNSEFQDAYYKTKEKLEGELSKRDNQIGSLQHELDQAKNLKSRRERELEDQLRARGLEHEAFRVEMADLKVRNDTTVAQLNLHLQTVIAERDALTARLTETDDKLAAETLRTADLTKQTTDLLAQAQGLTVRANTLANDVAQRDQALAAEKQGRETAEAQVRDLATRNDDLQTKVKAGDESLAQARAQSAELQKRLDEAAGVGVSLKQTQDEKAAVAEQLNKLRQENEQLKADLAGARQETQKVAESPRPTLADDQELNVLAGELKQKLQSLNAPGTQVIHDRRGLRVILPSDALFDKGTTVISEAGGGLLAPVIETLAKAGKREIKIEGHTDNDPVGDLPFADNWGLGSARADRVREFLMKQGGLNGRNLTALTRAAQDPLAPMDTSENKAKNRRVEIVIGDTL